MRESQGAARGTGFHAAGAHCERLRQKSKHNLPMEPFKPTKLTRLRRLPKRGHYDRETVYAILDAGFVCHVGYEIAGQPYVTPTAYWREGDALYWHGSAASQMVRTLEAGAPCCVTVSHLDALVMARSGFHHSVNFRSVMAFGRAHKVDDPAAKLAALDAFIERMYPGRNAELRRPSAKELRVTTVLALPLDEAVAKVRTGHPVDDQPDYALPVWAGLIPVEMKFGKPIDDPLLAPGITPAAALRRYRPARG